MKILILSHFFPPEMGGAAARIYGLSKWLAAMGHEVTVITSHPNYPQGEVAPELRRRLSAKSRMDGVDVITTWVYATKKTSKWHRLANYFSFVFSSAWAGLFCGRPDVIVASSPPLFIGLSSWVLSKRHRRPWILDIRDIWPQVAVEAGVFSADSGMARWGERLEKWLYRAADRITVVTKNKAQCVHEKGIPPEKTHLVENGVDLDLMEQWKDVPCEDVDWSQFDGKFLFTYAGLMGLFQGLDKVIEAAAAFRDDQDVQFLMIGEGPKRQELMELAEKLGANVTFVRGQPRQVIPGIIYRSQTMLVPLASEQLADAVPSKLLEAWACRRAALLVAGGEAKQLMEQSAGGFAVRPGDVDGLVAAMRACVEDPAAIDERGVAGFDFVSEHFDRRHLAKKMEQACETVVRN